MTIDQPDRDWASAWPDTVAFVSVLALAWWTRASATDLIWSLWLSSLVVGYAIIIWTTFRPVLQLGARAWRDQEGEAGARSEPAVPSIELAFGGIGAVGTLAFFTLHFGFFHYVQASILDGFFHIGPPHDWHRPDRVQELETFRLILRSYWLFLPAAFLAQRTAFVRAPGMSMAESPLAAEREAERLVTDEQRRTTALFVPYLKVLRMHVLIFFFFFVHFLGLENFAVYAVVYAVYFFPWRLFDRPAALARA